MITEGGTIKRGPPDAVPKNNTKNWWENLKKLSTTTANAANVVGDAPVSTTNVISLIKESTKTVGVGLTAPTNAPPTATAPTESEI